MKKFFKYGAYAVFVIILFFFALEQSIQKTTYECDGVITTDDNRKMNGVSYVRVEKMPRVVSMWADGYFYFELLSAGKNYIETSQFLHLKDDQFYDIGAIYDKGRDIGGFRNTNVVNLLELKLYFGRYSAICVPISNR